MRRFLILIGIIFNKTCCQTFWDRFLQNKPKEQQSNWLAIEDNRNWMTTKISSETSEERLQYLDYQSPDSTYGLIHQVLGNYRRKPRNFKSNWQKNDVWLEDGDLLVLKGGTLDNGASDGDQIQSSSKNIWMNKNIYKDKTSLKNKSEPRSKNNLKSKNIFESKHTLKNKNISKINVDTFKPSQKIFNQEEVRRNDRLTAPSFNEFHSSIFKPNNDKTAFNSKQIPFWGFQLHCLIC